MENSPGSRYKLIKLQQRIQNLTFNKILGNNGHNALPNVTVGLRQTWKIVKPFFSPMKDASVACADMVVTTAGREALNNVGI